MDGYLASYGKILGKKAVTSLRPLHVPGRDPLPDFEDIIDHAPNREPFPCQKHVIAAGVELLNENGSGFVCGEMGTGKTFARHDERVQARSAGPVEGREQRQVPVPRALPRPPHREVEAGDRGDGPRRQGLPLRHAEQGGREGPQEGGRQDRPAAGDQRPAQPARQAGRRPLDQAGGAGVLRDRPRSGEVVARLARHERSLQGVQLRRRPARRAPRRPQGRRADGRDADHDSLAGPGHRLGQPGRDADLVPQHRGRSGQDDRRRRQHGHRLERPAQDAERHGPRLLLPEVRQRGAGSQGRARLGPGDQQEPDGVRGPVSPAGPDRRPDQARARARQDHAHARPATRIARAATSPSAPTSTR